MARLFEGLSEDDARSRVTRAMAAFEDLSRCDEGVSALCAGRDQRICCRVYNGGELTAALCLSVLFFGRPQLRRRATLTPMERLGLERPMWARLAILATAFTAFHAVWATRPAPRAPEATAHMPVAWRVVAA